jgi:Predicted transcriptional regulators
MRQENCTLENLGYKRLETIVDMIGGKWKVRIVFMLALNGVLRYGELKKKLEPITHKMLTVQLKELIVEDLVIRKEYPQVPPKVEYSLSEKGRGLKPVVEKLYEWAEIHQIGKNDEKE